LMTVSGFLLCLSFGRVSSVAWASMCCKKGKQSSQNPLFSSLVLILL
jgi:hypothetical protein